MSDWTMESSCCGCLSAINTCAERKGTRGRGKTGWHSASELGTGVAKPELGRDGGTRGGGGGAPLFLDGATVVRGGWQRAACQGHLDPGRLLHGVRDALTSLPPTYLPGQHPRSTAAAAGGVATSAVQPVTPLAVPGQGKPVPVCALPMVPWLGLGVGGDWRAGPRCATEGCGVAQAVQQSSRMSVLQPHPVQSYCRTVGGGAGGFMVHQGVRSHLGTCVAALPIRGGGLCRSMAWLNLALGGLARLE